MCGRNKTGKALRQNGIDTPEVSLWEALPFKHSEAANQFEQKLFDELYSTDPVVEAIVNQWTRTSFKLEQEAYEEICKDEHPDTSEPPPPRVVYVGGEFPGKVLKSVFGATPVTLDGIPIELEESDDKKLLFYFQDHPSLHLLSQAPVDKKNFRAMATIWKALVGSIHSGANFNQQLDDGAREQVEKELAIAELIRAHFDVEEVLEVFPSAKHTADEKQMKWAVRTVNEKFPGNEKLKLRLAFGHNLRDMNPAERDEVAGRLLRIESKFGPRTLSSASFRAAAEAADETQFERLVDRALVIEAMFGDKMMGSDSFWAAIMNADKKQFERLVDRAAVIEDKFGTKMMGSDSFWSAIMNADKLQFERLVRRAQQVEAMFGDKALG
jgi:hypothetical protein